jgi:LCP family protein required for cell wall assembly
VRTTLKRGIGHVAGNGDGRGVLPPGALATITRYRQPERRRGSLALVGRIVLWIAAALVMLAGAIAGGAWLWVQKSVEAVQPHSADVIQSAPFLRAPLPGKPSIALVIGYDRRFKDRGLPSRSDTIMLIRADPRTKSISLLSFPRDLRVPVVCPGHYAHVGKINEAFADCKAKGTLATVKNLTKLPINYLITVNFRGFREIVDRLGGVWIDVDHRYYNRNVHTLDTNYASINLRPGYQRLSGQQALDFVRYRHTDSDLYRNARQQLFVKAMKQQISHSVGITSLLKIVGSITRNVEVGRGGGKEVSPQEIWGYARFAYTLPSGHVFQDHINGLTQATDNSDLLYSQSALQDALHEFVYPDVQAPDKAAARTLGVKVRHRGPGVPPGQVTVTVLNGNGVPGSAANASYLLGQRGYKMLVPPHNLAADAPSQNHFQTVIYFDPTKKRSARAATGVRNLFGSAVLVKGIPASVAPLANRAMTVVVVGKTFHNTLAPAPRDRTPPKKPPVVRRDPLPALRLLRKARHKVSFRLEYPTLVERDSELDNVDNGMPIHVYGMGGGHSGVRLVYRMPYRFGDYWGIQETDWTDAPALAHPSASRVIKGRRYDLYFNGAHLYMVVVRDNGVSYWVVNSLSDALSNETMLAIAKGLRPLRKR